VQDLPPAPGSTANRRAFDAAQPKRCACSRLMRSQAGACFESRPSLPVQPCPPLRYGKGMPKISSKHQITLPVETLERAGLSVGDEVTIEAEGADRIIVRRVLRDAEQALGVFDGLYEPDYLEQLRSGERA